MSRFPKSREAGFTLVELLVVIAIIALLASIVVLSLRKSGAIARESVCKANLYAQARAHSAYGSEHRFNKPPIVWKYPAYFRHALVSPNVKMNDQPVGQGILVSGHYMPLDALLCPASSMADDVLVDREAWANSSISGSSYSYFWRHSSSYTEKDDLLTGYKYGTADAEGRRGLSMDFNAQSGHTYAGAFDSSDWASHPILGLVNIAYSDGSVESHDNSKVVLKSPFSLDAKLEWWDLAHKAWSQ